ncbi:endonuclease/exonuclease/phosphatase family protein [Gimesia fumaroli]|uniref:Endonuclease/exonuclease/phosphatase domain-containing protein n=1 Tax=Gimesia fumaroli TaxID=2527976 RepID=A0A518I9Q4_9PLAN|nr:endonuclease/exonuclease/phosphatase family protein [Gimesia fumaroli]QDV49846.1 hypothetical protein Enr17x_18670 [Gimesia fumaroli]
MFYPSAQATTSTTELRVLCYNIRHCAGSDAQVNYHRIAKIILSVKPDIVLLQEVDRKTERIQGVDGLAVLSRLTGLKFVFGKNINFQGGHYGNAVLSRLPISKSINYPLPSPQPGEQRGLLCAHLQPHANRGGKVTVCSTHLDHRADNENRLASAKYINQYASDHPETSIILAGDLNANFDSIVVNELRKQWKLTNNTKQNSYPASQPKKQIDFILFNKHSQWKVKEFRVLNEPYASDHRPIFSVLEKLPDS